MKLWLYLAMLWIAFFSQVYAVDTSFYPHIEDANNLDSDNNVMDSLIQRRILNSSVDVTVTSIQFKEDERINALVQIAYNKCINAIWPWDIKKNWYNYSCLNLILTFTAENGWWHRDRVSPTSDYWLCQLHYKRHKDFIDSPEFKEPANQIQYCLEVRQDAYKKWRMPWVAYSNRNAMKSRFTIQY